jgi:hypothetical protein
MLEHGELVLRPWASVRAGGPAAPTRLIGAGRGGAVLGFAVRRPAVGWRFWPWSVPERFEVFETEDESLLLTATRGWANTWKVRDAEERLVGQIRGDFVYDGDAGCLAERVPGEDGRGRLVSGDETLAEWVRYEDGVRLSFADRLEKEPFAKMVLLAAVLTAEP